MNCKAAGRGVWAWVWVCWWCDSAQSVIANKFCHHCGRFVFVFESNALYAYTRISTRQPSSVFDFFLTSVERCLYTFWCCCFRVLHLLFKSQFCCISVEASKHYLYSLDFCNLCVHFSFCFWLQFFFRCCCCFALSHSIAIFYCFSLFNSLHSTLWLLFHFFLSLFFCRAYQFLV